MLEAENNRLQEGLSSKVSTLKSVRAPNVAHSISALDCMNVSTPGPADWTHLVDVPNWPIPEVSAFMSGFHLVGIIQSVLSQAMLKTCLLTQPKFMKLLGISAGHIGRTY